MEKVDKLLEPIRAKFTEKEQFVLRILEEMGHLEKLLENYQEIPEWEKKLKELLDELWEVESFYSPIGGLKGYYQAVIERISNAPQVGQQKIKFHKPEGLDLTKGSPLIDRIVARGIAMLPHIGEMYPIGGAGDRLDLRDPKTKDPLPVAQLKLFGHTLLEQLIRDVVARERLYFEIYGKEILTPIALMISQEKANDNKTVAFLESCDWFGRGKESFSLFYQPLAPVISEEGDWVMHAPLVLKRKPGGHGVIWKCAKEQGVFDWFKNRNRSHLLIRQINNPIAGLDRMLLALIGQSTQEGKTFGFASCPRAVNTSEGMIVCKEVEDQCGITNVEYTEFARHSIPDVPETKESPYSKFPANTNLLFAEIATLEKATQALPFPGLILNMKGTTSTTKGLIRCGRLETTMQNIADALIEKFTEHPPKQEKLQTYVLFNERNKTISVTKKPYIPGQPIQETPLGAIYDYYLNGDELLRKYCDVELPPLADEASFVESGLPYTFFYHPALGPLYSVISQKIQKGVIGLGASLSLEISDLSLTDLHLFGTFNLAAKDLKRGTAFINHLTIPKGVEVTINLEGESTLLIEGWTAKENLTLVIPHGKRGILDGEGMRLEQNRSSSKIWNYSLDEYDKVSLHRI